MKSNEERVIELVSKAKTGLRIVNLFPRLIGRMPEMTTLLPHCANLGFNVVWVQPFWMASTTKSPFLGKLGSCYAIKDHYRVDPRHSLSSESSAYTEELRNEDYASIRDFTRNAVGNALIPVADLVLNHVAHDHVWVTDPRLMHFFKRVEKRTKRSGHNDFDSDGNLVTEYELAAGMLDPFPNGGTSGSCWDDIAQFEYARSDCLEVMLGEWERLVDFHISLGFRGFRLDCVSLLPRSLLEKLTNYIRGKHGEHILLIGETLGAPWDAIKERLPGAALDAVTNSVFFWNGVDRFFEEELKMYEEIAPSVGCAGSHDTPWHASYLPESSLHLELRRRYVAALFLSEGVIMPYGYEFGTDVPLSVFKTVPDDLRKNLDICDFIREVNLTHDKVAAQRELAQARLDKRFVAALDVGGSEIAIIRKSKNGVIWLYVIACGLMPLSVSKIEKQLTLYDFTQLCASEHVAVYSFPEEQFNTLLHHFHAISFQVFDPFNVMQFID